MALKVSGAIRTTKPLAQLLQAEFDHKISMENYHSTGAPNVNFRKISVRKTI